MVQSRRDRDDDERGRDCAGRFARADLALQSFAADAGIPQVRTWHLHGCFWTAADVGEHERFVPWNLQAAWHRRPGAAAGKPNRQTAAVTENLESPGSARP